MLLEIERHLFVVQLGQERPHDEPRGHAEDRRDRHDPHGEDDAVGVVERVHQHAAERDESPSGRDGDGRAPQRELGAIPSAHAAHYTEELRLLATRPVNAFHGPLPFPALLRQLVARERRFETAVSPASTSTATSKRYHHSR